MDKMPSASSVGARDVAVSGSIGWVGFWTVLKKESKRFLRVSGQTVLAPVLFAVLYFLIFVQVLEENVQDIDGISYAQFLVPGLVIMSILQNAFSNTSSSLIQSKLTGNIIFLLLSPLSNWEVFSAYVLASIVRGFVVGVSVLIVTLFFVSLPLYSLSYVFLFSVLGGGLLGALGFIAGIWAEKIDQIAVFQNFIIMPLIFLSGVFYSVHTLSVVPAFISRLNPFLYIVDGFRYGCLGKSDFSPVGGLCFVFLSFLLVTFLSLHLLKKGYGLRN